MSQKTRAVVGTAGHIDHGKTSLVRALTGVDLDSQPEEKDRGITIALGFTPLDLPSGGRVAFVDVPGHERLVRTMIAGATGMDAVLLCVSAQDGAMPQTREHLAILQLLGITDGAVVLTKADLVDEELLELVLDDVQDLVQGTFLDGKPVVAFSTVTGQGADELLNVLASFRRTDRSDVGAFRLPVDRAFSRSGFGTVVTGTVWSGVLDDGSTVRLLPGDRTARVRGLQHHGAAVGAVRAGWRAAVNLAGVEIAQVPRGTVIGQGHIAVSQMIDASIDLLDSVDSVDDGMPVRVLLGTSEVLGRMYLADDEDLWIGGQSGGVQLRLDAPLACLPGDRLILRRTSPMQTLGGGVVVDPWAPRMRRNRRVRHGEQIERLRDGETTVWLDRAGEDGLDPAEWAARSPDGGGVTLGGRVLAAPVVARLEGLMLQSLTAFHEESPLSRGPGRRELRRGRLAHLPERVYDDLVGRLVAAELCVVHGSSLRSASFEVVLDQAMTALHRRIVQHFRQAGLAGDNAKGLHTAIVEPQVEALVRLLEHDGALVSVAKVGWILRDPLDELRVALKDRLAQGPMGPPDFKALTGLSRKTAIPLLEWMDRAGWTRREGDGRVAGAKL